jgi:8-oxo-dGTP diphosphatase
MPEHRFLETYDPQAYPRLSVAVDLVLLTVRHGVPSALLGLRENYPFKDHWTLPGGFVAMDESLEQAVERILVAKANLGNCYLEQLYTFGAVDRDPRMRIISIAYFALLPADRLATALDGRPNLVLAPLSVEWSGETGGSVDALSPHGEPLPLGFDHAQILGMAMQRLRGKLDYSAVAFALLPEQFTLRALQEVYEAILGTSLNKPAFRRRILDRGLLERTGEHETGTSFRPAELYRYRSFGQGDK